MVMMLALLCGKIYAQTLAVTLNPGDKSQDISLSNNNLSIMQTRNEDIMILLEQLNIN